MKRVVMALGGLVVAVLILACGGNDDQPTTGGAAGGASSATGPGISVQEALNSDLEGPLLINGFIVATGDGVRLCSALAESYPPQCAGESLAVEGLDLTRFDDLQEAEGVTWSNQVQVLGEVDDDTLVVSQNVIS